MVTETKTFENLKHGFSMKNSKYKWSVIYHWKGFEKSVLKKIFRKR